MAYDNTSFNINEYAAAALENFMNNPEAATDTDVVEALAKHIFDGFLDDESDKDFDSLQAYFNAADSLVRHRRRVRQEADGKHDGLGVQAPDRSPRQFRR